MCRRSDIGRCCNFSISAASATHPGVTESVFLLEPFPPPEEGAIVEHVVAVGVEAPVAPLAGLLVVPRHLDEALVQRQVVPDRVLPALGVATVVRNKLFQVLVFRYPD